MSDDMGPSSVDESCDEDMSLEPAAIARLRDELTRLRHQVEHEVRTRRIVIVDEEGGDRIRLAARADGGCSITLLDAGGFERSVLSGGPDGGSLRLVARPLGEGPARIDVFAVDPEDDAGAYVGVELVDDGSSVAGLTVLESRPPRSWTLERT